MKNVRLFAVAAALGMFASTVAAAEPTKTVTWSDVDSVIKVDLGEALVATAPTATVTLSEEKVEIGKVHAVDFNLNEDTHFLYNDAFNWSNPDDAMKVLGLNGYRFLAPGSAAVDEEVFVDQASGTVYNGLDEMFKALEEKKYVETKYTKAGDIDYVDIPVDWTYYASGKVRSVAFIRLNSLSKGGRYDEHIKEDAIDYLVNGKPLDDRGSYYTASVYLNDTEHQGVARPSVRVIDDEDTRNRLFLTVSDLTKLARYGAVVTVESKRGEYFISNNSFVDYGEPKIFYTARKTNRNAVSGVATRAEAWDLTALSAAAEMYFETAWDSNETATRATVEDTVREEVVATADTASKGTLLADGTGANAGKKILARDVAAVNTLNGDAYYTKDDAATPAYIAVADTTGASEGEYTKWTVTAGTGAIGSTYTAGFYVENGDSSHTVIEVTTDNSGLDTSKTYDTLTASSAKEVVATAITDTVTAVWNGTEAVTTVYKSHDSYAATDFSTPTDIKTLTSSVKYVLGQTGTDAFTAGDVKFLGDAINTVSANAATDKNYGVINEKYQTVALNTPTPVVLDAIAYVTADELGYTTRHIVDYDTTDIYYRMDNNTMKKITRFNKNAYFTSTALAAGKLYVGTTRIGDNLDNNTWPQTPEYHYATISGYAGLVETDGYDYVWGGYGYKTSSKVNAKNWTYGKAVYDVDATGNTIYPASQYTNAQYNQLTKLARPGTVTIVDISDAEYNTPEVTGTVQEYQGASVVKRITIGKLDDYTVDGNYEIILGEDAEVQTIKETATLKGLYDNGIADGGAGNANTTVYADEEYGHDGATTIGDYTSLRAGAYGIYEIQGLPANSTEYYVLAFNEYDRNRNEYEVYNGLDLTKIWSYSEAKGTGTLDALDGTDIDCLAVQLERKGAFYPAFKTQEELFEAVKKVTGLDKALVGKSTDKVASTFKVWYDHNVLTVDNGKHSDGVLNFVKDNDVNYDSLFSIVKSDGSITTNKVVDSKVDAADVVITSNKDEIDTSKAGVYELTYTASYKGETLTDTKKVTVVVAPKYTRTWENGRVKTLKSYYVTNPSQVYADYTYNWAAKTVTYTYYNVDGSVASQGTNNLD